MGHAEKNVRTLHIYIEKFMVGDFLTEKVSDNVVIFFFNFMVRIIDGGSVLHFSSHINSIWKWICFEPEQYKL